MGDTGIQSFVLCIIGLFAVVDGVSLTSWSAADHLAAPLVTLNIIQLPIVPHLATELLATRVVGLTPVPQPECKTRAYQGQKLRVRRSGQDQKVRSGSEGEVRVRR